MKEGKNWLAWLLTENLELVALMLATIIVLGVDLFDSALSTWIALETRLSIIMTFLALLAIHILRESREREQQFKKDREVLTEIDQMLKTGSSEIELVDPRERVDIWEGFEGEFCGWNPLFRLEERYGAMEDWLRIHRKRYLGDQVTKIRYLFFLGRSAENSDVKQSLNQRYERYRSFISRLYEDERPLSRALEDKLQTYVVHGDSNLVFFVGQKYGEDYCILYIDEEPFTTESGIPQWAFILKDSSLIKGLKTRFDKLTGGLPLSLEEVLTEDIWAKLQ